MLKIMVISDFGFWTRFGSASLQVKYYLCCTYHNISCYHFEWPYVVLSLLCSYSCFTNSVSSTGVLLHELDHYYNRVISHLLLSSIVWNLISKVIFGKPDRHFNYYHGQMLLDGMWMSISFKIVLVLIQLNGT